MGLARADGPKRNDILVDISPTLAIHPNIGELYRRKVSELADMLEDEECRAEAFELIRSMIERIEVSTGNKRGDASVLLVGGLASLLDFATSADNKKAAAGGSGFCRVLLVAGA